MTDPAEETPALPPASERQGDPGHDQALDRANAIRLLTLRTRGLTYDQIAAETGYADGSGARAALLRALSRHEAENVGQLRTLENLRLDANERVLAAIAGDPEKPAMERIRAIEARTRLAARRARLNGLDAPLQVAVTGGALAALDDALALLEGVVHDVVPGAIVRDDDDPPPAGALVPAEPTPPSDSDGVAAETP